MWLFYSSWSEGLNWGSSLQPQDDQYRICWAGQTVSGPECPWLQSTLHGKVTLWPTLTSEWVKLHGNTVWPENLVVQRSTLIFATAKLKPANISYLHIAICMAIPCRTAKFKFTNIFSMAILDPAAKFNSHQYSQLYGIAGTFSRRKCFRKSEA